MLTVEVLYIAPSLFCAIAASTNPLGNLAYVCVTECRAAALAASSDGNAFDMHRAVGGCW